MEVELDASFIGQSFEKVGESISKEQMEELQTLGPLDQNADVAPTEKWLQDPNKPSTGLYEKTQSRKMHATTRV